MNTYRRIEVRGYTICRVAGSLITSIHSVDEEMQDRCIIRCNVVFLNASDEGDESSDGFSDVISGGRRSFAGTGRIGISTGVPDLSNPLYPMS